MRAVSGQENPSSHIKQSNPQRTSTDSMTDAGQSWSTMSSEGLWVTPEDVQQHMHTFFDTLFTRLMAIAEAKINEKICLIRGTKQMNPENKAEFLQFFMKADAMDELMNLEINKLEFSLREDFSGWTAGPSFLDPTELLQGESGGKRLERYCATRESIRAEFEEYEDRYRVRYLENVKHTYCKRFTESLPSLKAPGIGPNEANFEIEKNYNLLQSFGIQNSSYQNEEVHIHNTESYLARVDSETQKALKLRELFQNLSRTLETPQDDDSDFDSQKSL